MKDFLALIAIALMAAVLGLGLFLWGLPDEVSQPCTCQTTSTHQGETSD